MVPCGVTNSLGNKTGVVNYTYKKSDDTDGQTLSVPSYRGLENPFGHVWSWTDGCKCNVQSDAAGGLSEFFVCTDPAKFQDSDYTDYENAVRYPAMKVMLNYDDWRVRRKYADRGGRKFYNLFLRLLRQRHSLVGVGYAGRAFRR